jgi:hypothetical protein
MTKKIENLSDLAHSLLNKIEITKGSQHAAVKRYNDKSNISLVSISVLSIYVISLSFYSILFVDGGPDQSAKDSINFFNYFALTISSFILFQNAFEAGKKYDLKAAKLHNSARELSVLYNKIELYLSSVDPARVEGPQIDGFSNEYNSIMQRNSEDHENIDFFYHQFRRRPKFPIRLTPYDKQFAADYGPIEHWTPMTHQIVEERIDADYSSKKRRFKHDQTQHIMARFSRWIDVYFSFIVFVVVPPLVMPPLYFIYMHQKDFVGYVMGIPKDFWYLSVSVALIFCAVSIQAIKGMLEDRGPKYWVNFSGIAATAFGVLYLAARVDAMPQLMTLATAGAVLAIVWPALDRMLEGWDRAKQDKQRRNDIARRVREQISSRDSETPR